MKHGPTAMAERMNRKKVDGQISDALAKRERTSAQHAVQPAQRSLVEEREERAHAGQHVHQLVQIDARTPGTKGPARSLRFFSTIGRYSINSTVR